VTERHTKQEFAEQMRWLVDEQYPQAERIRVVLDNLSTHRAAALYERYEPEEARRILRKLEFHYTPKHGSWLNIVEIELSVLERQCLNRRIPDAATLEREVAAYEARRNEAEASITWDFTVEDARRKLKRLYPSTPL
jgi:transposase